MTLPKPVIERHGKVLVVRDDLIEGGTKRRILPALLTGAREFVYASPVYGYAQIALAHACREAGYQATVFVAKRNELHPRTREAVKAGAKVVQVPYGYLSNVQAKARDYAASAGAKLLPFGLDVPEMTTGIQSLAKGLGVEPQEVWTVAGSGTLSRALQCVWPQARFYAVRVGAEFDGKRATVLNAPEKFEQDAKQLPPFRSCLNYDAKAWRFIQQRATEDALFWNVAA
jgi:hypothetical protein